MINREEIKNKITAALTVIAVDISGILSAIIRKKRRLLLAGLLLTVFGLGIYVAKDSLMGIFSSQKEFLGALFVSQNDAIFSGDTSSAGGKVNNATATAARNCSFETSQIPKHDKVVFNEIAWMGNKENANNEWLEFKNVSLDTIEVTGWRLLNQNEKIKIVFNKGAKIPASGFYLLERGGADFLPGVKADAFFTGALKNSGDSFRLFNKDCNLIDEVIASSGWPAGDNKTKATMERDSKTFAWYVSGIAGGTPRTENTPFILSFSTADFQNAPNVQAAPSATPERQSAVGNSEAGQPPSSLPSPLSNTYNHLLISEVMIGIEGSRNHTFVEFYNPTPDPVDLTGWTIKKKTSTGSESPFIIADRLKDKIVPPGRYFLTANDAGYTGAVPPDVKWPNSYTLAYSNNAIVVYNNLNEKIEEVSWTSIPKGQSYERDSWLNNIFHLQTAPSPQNSQSQ